MSMSDTPAPVLFEERAAADQRIGIATLNSPRTLNGFSLQMAHLLDAQLQRWAADDSIALVLLQGAGEKAFCAGGDLHSLYRSMCEYREAGQQDIRANGYAKEFFEVEYRLDHRIHTYAKPILCWGHGIVMGGGIGLMSGASHRVVSERSKLAFPEISVGLFPDVGGSWLLSRMAGHVGRFLALTGAILSPGDAIHAGLADAQLPESSREDVLAALMQTAWSASSRDVGAQLDAVLAHFAMTPEAGPLQGHAQAIATACEGDSLESIVAAIRALPADAEPWLATAQAAMAAGAPGSLRLGFELQRRAASMSLAGVFQMEYIAALHCAAHGDFAEGIRALLIDKDRNPSWNPARLDQADADWAAQFLIEPDWPEGVHPLADLGTSTP